MKLIKGEFKERLELQFAQAVKAGFPSPAEDYMGETLDFNRDLIRNPEATFYALVDGDSMMDVGICKGDIAVIDRSIEPHCRSEMAPRGGCLGHRQTVCRQVAGPRMPHRLRLRHPPSGLGADDLQQHQYPAHLAGTQRRGCRAK